MGQQGPLPYLEFCGVEVANAARTTSYLRAGLGNTAQGHWELGPGDVCSVLYRNGSGCGRSLYLSPAADPAPWYDPSEPGSATFLGAVMIDIDGYDSTITRGVTARLNALGGGVFAQQHRSPRTWKFRAALISADDKGAEFGLRWLTQVLQASACATCSTCDLSVRLVCPPDDCSNDSLGLWSSYDVALTDGPHETEKYGPVSSPDALGACRDYVTVEFTMTAGNPFLYKPPVTLIDTDIFQQLTCDDICAFLFGDTSVDACATVTPPTRGVLGSVYTLFSRYGFGSVILSAFDVCPGGSGGVDPTAVITLSSIPAGSTVVVDSSRHRITVTDADGVVTDGTNLVTLDEGKGIEWIEVRDCDTTTCFCAGPAQPCDSGTLEVLIQSQVREG